MKMVAIFSRHIELEELRRSLISQNNGRIPFGYVWHLEHGILVGKRVFENGNILEFVITITDDDRLHGEFVSQTVDLTNLHPDLQLMNVRMDAGVVWSWLLDAEGSNFSNLSGYGRA